MRVLNKNKSRRIFSFCHASHLEKYDEKCDEMYDEMYDEKCDKMYDQKYDDRTDLMTCTR